MRKPPHHGPNIVVLQESCERGDLAEISSGMSQILDTAERSGDTNDLDGPFINASEIPNDIPMPNLEDLDRNMPESLDQQYEERYLSSHFN
jgi:hypothetical protein